MAPVEIMELDEMGLAEIEQNNSTVEEIDAEAADLLFVGIDESGSMDEWIKDMIAALDDFKTSMQNSKESEHILVARANFYDQIDITGYKPIDEFDTSYTTYGSTLFYDMIVLGAQKLKDYVKYLKGNGMRVKAVFSAFTDGEDNGSEAILADAKREMDELNRLEYPTAAIAFGAKAVKMCKNVGFKNIIDITNEPNIGSALRKAFNRLSKSVVENSKLITSNTDNFFI